MCYNLIMLSIFPALLAYNLAVPLIFRIAVGLIFICFGYSNLKKNREEKISALAWFKLHSGKNWLILIALIEILGGTLLFIGLYTQVAALVLSIVTLVGILAKQKNPDVLKLSAGFLYLLLLVTLSLLLLGPGFYAFDLPL